MNRPKAVVLLSGGVDSATALALAVRDGFDPHALSFCYGQRHADELIAARNVAHAAGVTEHAVVDLDLRRVVRSALTGAMPVPKGRTPGEMGAGTAPTYVPARNTIFLSFALAWAETLGSSDIFLGVNALDFGGYPDCRPDYVEAYERMAALATDAGRDGRPVKIHTPLILMTKADVIRTGLALGVDYALTLSCYDPTRAGACGACDSCLLRLEGFAANGVKDPAVYR